MWRQRKMFQTKDQDKTPEKELNETETHTLSDKELETLVVIRLFKVQGKNRQMSSVSTTKRTNKKRTYQN